MNFFFLPLVILLALSLRFFDLGGVPVGFHRDEAHFGYNSYSLMQTGRDITGNYLPLHIASFLHSPAGYAYLSIPSIMLFGLNEFSIRFVSAFFGTLTILLTYFLVIELFKNKRLALLTSLFLAISPWHVNLSRVATENVVVVFFIILGSVLYLKWIKHDRKVWMLFLSFFCFALTLFLYQAPRAFLPLFLPLLFIIYPPKLVKRNIFISVFLFAITILFPIISILSSHTLTERIRMLSIFQHPETQLVLDEQIRENGENNPFITRVFHNKIINYSQTFFSNYFSHFSYNFLLTDKGLPDRYRVSQMGLIYFFDLPLLLFGLWKLFNFDKRKTFFLLGWILLAPLGSSLTFDDVPNLQRTLLIFPALTIISSYGFLAMWDLMKDKKFVLLKSFMVLIITYGVLYYLHQYYVHQVNHRPWFRQEGYKELMTQINKFQLNYKKVVITDAQTEPAIFYLFYNHYDPHLIQSDIVKQKKTRVLDITIDKYSFGEEPCPLHTMNKIDNNTNLAGLSGEKGILYINGGDCPELDQRARLLSEIKRSDGTVVFRLYDL